MPDIPSADDPLNVPEQNQAIQSERGAMKSVVLVVVSVLVTLGLLCGGVVAYFVFASYQITQDANRLKAVALGFHNYESAYKKFPSPFAVNESDTPVWSWRVPILHFIEERKLGDEAFRLRMKPWDTEGNEILQGECPAPLRSRLDASHSDTFIVSLDEEVPGDPTAFVNRQWIGFRNLYAGTSGTLMLIQYRGYSRPWAEPATLTPDEAFRLLQEESRGCNIAMFDGSVTFLPKTTDRATFDALLTPDDRD